MDITEDRLLRLRAVTERVGMSKATLYRKIADGSFPKPVSIGGPSVRWRASDIDAWMRSLVTNKHE